MAAQRRGRDRQAGSTRRTSPASGPAWSRSSACARSTPSSCGWRPGKEEGTVGSLILGLYDDDGELHVVGHTSGFKAKEKRELPAKLAPYETGERGIGRAQPLDAGPRPRVGRPAARAGRRGQLRPRLRRPDPARREDPALARGQGPARLHDRAAVRLVRSGDSNSSSNPWPVRGALRLPGSRGRRCCGSGRTARLRVAGGSPLRPAWAGPYRGWAARAWARLAACGSAAARARRPGPRPRRGRPARGAGRASPRARRCPRPGRRLVRSRSGTVSMRSSRGSTSGTSSQVPSGSRRGRPASGGSSTPRRRCGRARSGCSRRRPRGAPPSTTCSWPAVCAARPRGPAPGPLGGSR